MLISRLNAELSLPESCPWSPTEFMDLVGKKQSDGRLPVSFFSLGNVPENWRHLPFCFLKLGIFLTIRQLTIQLHLNFTACIQSAVYVYIYIYSGKIENCPLGVFSTAAKRYWPSLPPFIESFHNGNSHPIQPLHEMDKAIKSRDKCIHILSSCSDKRGMGRLCLKWQLVLLLLRTEMVFGALVRFDWLSCLW